MRRIVGLIVWVLLAFSVGTAAAEDGAAIYAQRCAFCHGPTGKGDGPSGQALQPPPRDFTRAEYWAAVGREQQRTIIAEGKAGTAMVPFKQLLNAAQIDAVVTYLESFRPAK